MVKYNLGCGSDFKSVSDGWVNWDKKELDLDEKFILDDADVVYLRSVLEHLNDPERCLCNIQEYCNNIIINTPSFSPIVQHRLNLLHYDSFNFLVNRYGFQKTKVKRFFTLKGLIYRLRIFFECILFDRFEIVFKRKNRDG